MRITNVFPYVLFTALLFVSAFLLQSFFQARIAVGSAPSGLFGTLATTSTVGVGPNVPNVASTTISLFTASKCNSRVITTVGKPISLQFSESAISSTTANPSATTGHLQLASTTVAYDSGIYGCGYWSAYGHDATTTITISEFR